MQESGSVLEQVLREGCDISILRDFQNSFGWGPGATWSHSEVGHALKSSMDQKSHLIWILLWF